MLLKEILQKEAREGVVAENHDKDWHSEKKVTMGRGDGNILLHVEERFGMS